MQWDSVHSAAMPPKQKTKAELKQAVDQLTEKLQAAEARHVESEREDALAIADEAEQLVLDLEQEIEQLKKDFDGAQEHVTSAVEHEVETKLKKVKSEVAGSKEEHVGQLELVLDDAHDEVDHLEWKLEDAERDAELQAARVKERWRADHRKELKARDDHSFTEREAKSDERAQGYRYRSTLTVLKQREQVYPRSLTNQGRRLGLGLAVDVQYAYLCQPCLHFRAKSVGNVKICLNDGCGSWRNMPSWKVGVTDRQLELRLKGRAV